MKGLTRRQEEILEYINASIQERGYPPTIREIGKQMGIRSTNGVNDHLKALERKGVLTRDDLKSRALRPVGQNDDVDFDDDGFVEVRLLGRVAAGTWMLISMVLVALFTATVTTALTASQSEVHVRGASDLARARVGIVENASAEVYFADHFLPHVSYPTIGAAMHDLGKGHLDAIVADRDVLMAAIAAESREHALEHPVRVIPKAIGRRPLAFGLRRSLPADFIRRFDEALLARVRAQPQPSTAEQNPEQNPQQSPQQNP
jgi:hypothetical protein